MSRFTLRFKFPLVRRGSHLGSGSWLCSGLGERLSASWRKSTVLDPGIVPPHLLRFTSCPWVCEPTGHVDFSHNNKKMVTVIPSKLFSVLWWASANVKVHSSLTVHNSQRRSRPSQRSYELIIVCAANGWWVATANNIFQNHGCCWLLYCFLERLSQFLFDRKWTILIKEESIKCNYL